MSEIKMGGVYIADEREVVVCARRMRGILIDVLDVESRLALYGYHREELTPTKKRPWTIIESEPRDDGYVYNMLVQPNGKLALIRAGCRAWGSIEEMREYYDDHLTWYGARTDVREARARWVSELIDELEDWLRRLRGGSRVRQARASGGAPARAGRPGRAAPRQRHRRLAPARGSGGRRAGGGRP